LRRFITATGLSQRLRSSFAIFPRRAAPDDLQFHPLLIGGSPFRASAIYCLISFLEQRWGVHFAMGGTGRLVSGLVNLIKGQGGVIRCDTEVTEIIVEDGAATGVRLSSGENAAGAYRRLQRRLGMDLSASFAFLGASPLDRSQD